MAHCIAVPRLLLCLAFSCQGGVLLSATVLRYSAPQGQILAGTTLFDDGYTGSTDANGILSGGRGQLVDSVVGPSNWKENAGREWVGWDGSHAVPITIEFEGETLLGKLTFSSNNNNTDGIGVFERVACSVGSSINDLVQVVDYESTWWDRNTPGLVSLNINLSGYRGSMLQCILYPSTKWLLLGEVQFESDCYFGSGQAYRGNISATWLQLPCQPWNLQTPHAHAETPLSHPDSGLDGNYCRNPRGARERPWCYTNNTDTEWDYCNLPACGELLIDGQPRLPVTFGATGIPLSKGTWPGIVIEAQTLNKTATIRHAEFLGCSTCVTVRSSDVDVDWVRVRRCTQYGFYLEDTSDDGHAFRISNTSVRDCSNGIYATGGEKGRFEIVSTVLMDNSEAGLCLQGMASTTVLTSRLVKNGAGIRANPGAGRVTIIACEFSRQQQIGLEMKNFESLLITNSTFDGNGQGCILMSGGIITLEGNIFVGNSYVGVFITVVVNLSLVNNIFENNGVQQNEYGVVQIGTNILFQNNTLVNNTAGTTAAALFVGSATAVLRFNVFSNPACPHELWYNAPYSAGELDARHNFWGVAEATTVEPRRIRARLFDFYDDLTKGIVQMAPFYRDSFFAVVVYGAGEAVSPNGFTGGAVREITLRKVEMSKFELFQVTDTNVSLTNVTLSDSQSGLKLSCDGTCLINITVESCTFAGVLGAAINVQGVYDCFLKVSNSSFVNVMGNALRYENVFQNPTSEHEVVTVTRNPRQHLEMSRNYWGSWDPIVVHSRIQDFHQDSSLEAVAYSPFYTDASLTKLSAVSRDFWTESSLPFGGVLSADFTIKGCDGSSMSLIHHLVLCNTTTGIRSLRSEVDIWFVNVENPTLDGIYLDVPCRPVNAMRLRQVTVSSANRGMSINGPELRILIADSTVSHTLHYGLVIRSSGDSEINITTSAFTDIAGNRITASGVSMLSKVNVSESRENYGLYVGEYRNVLNATVAGCLIGNNRCSLRDLLTDVKQNLFENAEDSVYDLWVSFSSAGPVLDATNNWWSETSEEKVIARIKSPENVNWKPFLTDLTFSCEGVSNCSGNGLCIRHNLCRCHSGHAGAACADAACDGVQSCSQHGSCVGPNRCACHEGWAGAACADITCSDVNDCSGHGVCYAPNSCQCYRFYIGLDCSRCQDGFWGPSCSQCPLCVNGKCDVNTGECACIDPKWMGALCDRCVDGLYGPDCLALPVVLDVLPKEGSDLGGTTVTVMGRNLKASADGGYRCEFGDQVVEGTWLSREQVRCVTPKHVAGTVLVNVAPDRSGQSPFTTSTVEFTFYQQCPTSGCGRLLGTPHGICSFGQCVCTLPWHGDNCELEYLAPVLEAVPDATTIEGQSYREALRLLGVRTQQDACNPRSGIALGVP
ncbi:unnamed protein product [Lampetra planeri]